MKVRGVILIVAAGCALQAALGSTEESAGYLGKKLEYVLENVDNAYIEQCKKKLATRHRKAFQKLGEHLEKKYPDLEVDLFQWIEEEYGTSVKETEETRDEKYVLLETLLTLDREHQEFRESCIAHLRSMYPNLFGDIACFLRDNHLAALREVLHATLRMTSHVPSSPIAMGPQPEEVPEQDRNPEPQSSGEISMVP